MHEGVTPGRDTRVRLAQALALVALVAALVAALGPAEDARTTYSWPPALLPEGTPTEGWYSPLLLIRHRPEAMAATLPCSDSTRLPRAERPTVVLATARFPERSGGLAVTRERDGLVVRIGREVLTSVDLGVAPANGACAVDLRLAGERWTVGGAGVQEASGSLERMPFVSGVFSALDVRQEPRPTVRLTTAPHASRPLLRQQVGWVLAVACALAALILVALTRRPRPLRTLREGVRAARAHAHPVDLAVGLALAGWWVLAPASLDDGWVIARERMYDASDGFSYYYTDFGANLPNDFWLEWAQHWLADNSLLAIRVPALLCLAAVWVLLRWTATRILASVGGGGSVALWALAGSFLIGSLAWGMTARPEPVTALFVTAVLACTVRFLERRSPAPLAVVAALLPFAVSAHHAAVVAFAPLLVASPTLLRWARRQIPVASVLVASSLALLAVLLFVGADLDQRRAEAVRISPTGESGHPWADEIDRYALLADMPPLRRAPVALIALAVLAFLVRRSRGRQPLLDLPAASLALGLLLLVATPSKLPWHFGALLGIAAVAVAAETTRLRQEGRGERGWEVKPFLAIGAAAVAIGWTWSASRSWGIAELRSVDWTLGFEDHVTLARLAALLPLVLLAGGALVELRRKDRQGLRRIPWRVASWTAVILAAPLVAFTGAVLVADAAKSPWTLARQNLGTLAGRVGCGLADDLVAAVPRTNSLVVPRPDPSDTAPAWVPRTPVDGLPRFALGPAAERTMAASPWFAVPAQSRVGFFFSGRPTSSDRLEVKWGRARDGGVRPLGGGEIDGGAASEAGAALPWWFVPAGELPLRPPGADLVRVTFASNVAPGTALALTAPVAYEHEPLSLLLDASASRSLAFTDQLTYVPCVELPTLHDGIVEVPDHLVVSGDWPSPIADQFTSPFAGLLDLYPIERLPLSDSENPPPTMRVFKVDRRIPGVLLAPAEIS